MSLEPPTDAQAPAAMDELDTEAAREIVKTPSPLTGEKEHQLEYIQQMIQLAADDARHVALNVTFSLSIAALLVSQLPLERVLGLAVGFRVALCVGIIALAGAALAYFSYVRELHKTRMKMTRCLPTIHVVRVRELWAGTAGVWKTQGWRYKTGFVLLGVGLVLVGVVLAAIYVGGPRAVK